MNKTKAGYQKRPKSIKAGHQKIHTSKHTNLEKKEKKNTRNIKEFKLLIHVNTHRSRTVDVES